MSDASDDEAAAMLMEAGSSTRRRRPEAEGEEYENEEEEGLDSEEAEADDEEEQSAFPIGAGRAHFLFTVDIVGWGGDGHGLQLPEPGAGGMWLSYILFKSVACTDRFYELGNGNGNGNDAAGSPGSGAQDASSPTSPDHQQHRHRRSTDMFRLRSRADGADLAAWFAGAPVAGGEGGDPNGRWLQIFLCAPQRFVAVARLDLWQLLMEARRPGQVGRGFFPHEASGRFEMEAWEEDGPSGVAGGAWVDVRLRIEREEGDVDEGGEAEAEEEAEAGSERNSIMLGDVTIPYGPPPLDDDDDEEEEEEDDDEELGGRGRLPGRRRGMDRASAPRRAPTARVEEGEATRRPGGLRAFRLSMDLRAVRGLPRAQRLFLYHHYPHLSEADPRVALGGSSASASAGSASASVGPGPVVTEPVWVPARGEGPMRKGCCSFTFRGTYDLLGEATAAHPFRVALKALVGEGGGSVEVGQAVLPLSELLEDAPVTYRSAVKPKLFRSYGACQRYLDRVAEASTEPQAPPIIMRVLDTYVPVVLREAAGGGGNQTALRAVLVLEDLGPAPEGDEEKEGEGQDLDAAAASASVVSEVGARVPPLTSFMSSSAASVPSASFIASQPPPGQGQGEAGSGPYSDLSVALTLLDVERKKLEFEDWRHKREVEWSDRLRAKEAQRMEQLERAYEAREAERKARFQQVQEELARLEAQLRRSLSEVEARERRLATEEAALEQQAAKQADEAQALQRRLREEARYQGERDRRRVAEQEERVTRLTRQVELAERKALEAQEEFARYRREQRRQTPAALQAEVVQLTKDKAELEARCEKERAERTQAQLEKEQYRAALQRTARALKREQARKLGDLRGQLEQLSLEYMARDERFRSCGSREELHAIKRTLDALRRFGSGGKAAAAAGLSTNTRKPGPPPAHSQAQAGGVPTAPLQEGKENSSFGGFVPMPPPKAAGGGGRGAGRRRRGLFTVLTERRDAAGAVEEDDDDQATLPNPTRPSGGVKGVAEEVARLRRERDMLLSSGNYDVDDPIIQELTRLIGEREGAVGAGASGAGGGGVPEGVVSQASTITFSNEEEEDAAAAVVAGGGGGGVPAGASVSS